MMPQLHEIGWQKPLGELQVTSGTRFEAQTTKILKARETHIVNGLTPDFSHGLHEFRT
ncbi:MAG: hypothetical protein WBD78_00930 [Methylocella sp.]